MVDGSRLLRRHLTASKRSLRDFASEVGTSGSLVWMWCAGERTPGIAFALRIEEATAGKVPVRSWLGSGKKIGKRPVAKSSAPHVAKRGT